MLYTIPHSCPTISSRDIKAVSAVLKSGHIAQGKKVAEFERELTRFLKAKQAVATNSGTSALHLSLLALGVGRGDQVIVPSFVCSALLHAVLYTGARPVVADVDEHDFNISAGDVRKKITSKTKAVIVPHMFGCPADVKALKKIGIPIIEDCAQAIGAKYLGRKVGTLGDLSIFSFYATKVLTTAEGGMVISSNLFWLNKIKDLREYDKKNDFRLRFNYKMSDLQAALGISQLSQLPQWIERRRKIAEMYHRAFSGLGWALPEEEKGHYHIYYRYVVRLGKQSGRLIEKLRHGGIQCSLPVSKPLHRYFGKGACPVSDELMTTTCSIPIYPTLTNKQVAFVIRSIKNATAR